MDAAPTPCDSCYEVVTLGGRPPKSWRDQEDRMNSHYRWVIVAVGAFMGCVAIGSIFSLPVFLQPMSVATGWSRTGICWR
jgi:hypothetical protein